MLEKIVSRRGENMGWRLSNCIWIAWEKHRRSTELADTFGIRTFFIVTNLPRLLKYPLLLFKTYLCLRANKDKTIIVQNPSIILTVFCCIMKRLVQFSLIVDSHNAGLIPEIPLLKKMEYLYSYYVKKADRVLVTNDELCKVVLRREGRPILLPDKLPRPATSLTKPFVFENSSTFNLTFICTFGRDEPYDEFFKAASLLEDMDITIFVTGSYKKRYVKTRPLSGNLVFTGFLEDEQYWALLANSDLVIDLTTREACLVCGAYEAVAVKTPLVLSDTRALRKYFYKGVVFTENQARSIAASIKSALENLTKLKREIAELQDELERKWYRQAEKFVKESLISAHP